jgi:hypothetical protein
MGIMQYKLIKVSHFEFEQNLWKSLRDKWKISFMSLWKRSFTAWLKIGITQERLVKVACIEIEELSHGAGDRLLHNAFFFYLVRNS